MDHLDVVRRYAYRAIIEAIVIFAHNGRISRVLRNGSALSNEPTTREQALMMAVAGHVSDVEFLGSDFKTDPLFNIEANGRQNTLNLLWRETGHDGPLDLVWAFNQEQNVRDRLAAFIRASRNRSVIDDLASNLQSVEMLPGAFVHNKLNQGFVKSGPEIEAVLQQICREPGRDTICRGEAVLADMANILAGKPEAIQLAERVIGYFGASLILKTTQQADTSMFSVNLDHRCITITLKTNTNRVPAALAHELLHASLLIDRFPWTYSMSDAFLELANMVYHELMYEPFIRLGFPAHEFTAPGNTDVDYSNLPHSIHRRLDWWCREYYKHLLSWRHSGDEHYQAAMDATVKAGMRQYPDFPDRVSQIQAWSDRREFRSNTRFVGAVDQLVRIMNGPWVDYEWYRVKSDGMVMTRRKVPIHMHSWHLHSTQAS